MSRREELVGEFALRVANGPTRGGLSLADALDWYAMRLASLMLDAQPSGGSVIGCANWLIGGRDG